MGFLEQKISELALSKTEKRVADYILVNQDNVGLKTVTELAEMPLRLTRFTIRALLA